MRTHGNFLPKARGRLALCLLAATFSLNAHAWWDNGWSNRTELTLNYEAPADAQAASAVSEAPVLVRLHVGNFNFSAAREDGADLRFIAADDKTALPFHIAQYDPLIGEAFAWVKLSDIKPGTPQSFWLYYGNPGAGHGGSSQATYNESTRVVYHFGERGEPARDFSGNNNNAVNAGVPVDGALIGTGIRFDGQRAIEIPATDSLRFADNQPLTLSLWLKPAVNTPNAIVFNRSEGNSGIQLGLNNGVPFAAITRNGSTRRLEAAEALPAGSWAHLALGADANGTTLYVNGTAAANAAVSVPALASASYLGASAATPGSGSTGFSGDAVEFNLAATALPASYIRFLAQSQGGASAATILGVGAEQTSGGGGEHSGYFTVILQSLTFDGWVVVVLCAVMAAISWVVMYSKNAYINAAHKGNALFLDVFNSHVAKDLTILDNADTGKISSMGGTLTDAQKKLISRSPLYRVYHVGAEEIRKRLEISPTNGQAADAQKKSLSSHAIKSVSASLDGAQVREGQRLNRQIVLLTIAISGGPFLGLLGTVVGVMITFAAVAMAGDVNVNAIAPGIAAALLATVAGLAVAIPALFGYNYLLSRIKDVSADMQVFADEFITKVAEFYPDNGSSSDSH